MPGRDESEEPSAFAAGAVTRAPREPEIEFSVTGGSAWSGGDVIQQGKTDTRKQLFWFGGFAAMLAVIGLIVVVVVGTTGGRAGLGGTERNEAAPPDVRPPLARLCPPPTAPAVPTEPPTAAVPSGPRTVDSVAGISYKSYGEPWEKWNTTWVGGTLEVPYRVGQHFVTETYSGGSYHASILSAAVPATVNDSFAIDLDCTGKQVAADVRAEYYPQPNTSDNIREERVVLGGRPAWVNTFRLHFETPGLKAKSELVAVALIDVGKTTAAVLYVSIPDTHKQFDSIVDEVLASVRPT